MNHYPFDRNLSNEADVLNYYIDAIHYRNEHKDQSTGIAMHVFDMTHPQGMLSFPVSQEVEGLRFEFGALEAPGMPEDDEQPVENYDDMLWTRLFNLIDKAKKNRTV